jgi:hypothetical protein
MNFDSPAVYLFIIYCWDGAQPEISSSAAAATVTSVKCKYRIILFSLEFDSKHNGSIGDSFLSVNYLSLPEEAGHHSDDLRT